MLNARQRIERQKASPALVRLHHALSRLKSTVTLMHTGAHPDDEQNGLLAHCRFALGMRTIIACSTRGEGGQNALGPERGGALGVIRSRELEEAARVIDADIHWLGHGPEDPLHDFGFSKDGDSTFARWGKDHTVERLVRAYRQERPDIVIPTFLDVPGQHGHHRAMTEAAEEAIALAADPKAYPEHFEQGLTPWQVAKYYLPAWSGGGDTYDDEVPPPEATLVVGPVGYDEATGAEYGRIDQWSRLYHASQGMGVWPDTVKSQWPLHLQLPAPQTEADILDTLPASLGALALVPEVDKETAGGLVHAQRLIDEAIALFPARADIVEKLVLAGQAIDHALTLASPAFLALHGHRLQRKRREIDAALFEAAALFERAFLEQDILTPGGETQLRVCFGPNPGAVPVESRLVVPDGATIDVDGRVHIDQTANLTPLYEPLWSALGGNGQAFLALKAHFGGYTARMNADLEVPLAIVPAVSVSIDPPALIVPTAVGSQGPWPVALDIKGTAQRIEIPHAGGWQLDVNSATLKAPTRITPGLFRMRPTVDEVPAWRSTEILYPHIGTAQWRDPAELQVLALDLELPSDTRIGYVGGGADNAGLWLKRMGFDVTDLEADDLAGDLSRYSTIVVGIFAFGQRPDLAAARAKLHRFVEQGGNLVTLYHRPGDGWNPTETPPRPITIGSPSLRWRVTDPQAPVTMLLPDHPLLAGPNRITESDWQGWNKERGLYFASSWDEAYQPLLAMHDDGEQPLKGALISAEISKGRHTHVSLVLHHQLDHLVPGAFRLMANLVQPV
jgi:LmbE family N-acetylglucosaminyl deacetylase